MAQLLSGYRFWGLSKVMMVLYLRVLSLKFLAWRLLLISVREEGTPLIFIISVCRIEFVF